VKKCLPPKQQRKDWGEGRCGRGYYYFELMNIYERSLDIGLSGFLD